MEGLDVSNILMDSEINTMELFSDEGIQEGSPEEEQPKNEPEKQPEKQPETTDTTEVNVDNLFTEQPESVGSEENNKEKESTVQNENNGTSQNNFYSSMTKALMEDGIFPNLDDSTVSDVKSAEDFANLIEQQVQSKLDERQKRIDEALSSGIEVSDIQRYENTIAYLDKLSQDNNQLEAETPEAENIRKQLIYQDFINKGFSKERAQRELNKSLQAGTDIEDAKEALKSNKEFFQKDYQKLIQEAKDEEQKFINERKAQAEKLKDSILNSKEVFGDIQLDKSTRQKVYDNISRPIYKDEDGNYLTAIQKYEMENKTDFLKNVGLLFTLTDGFTNLDKLIKGNVNKEVKKSLRELEHTLNNTARTADGNLKFVSGVGEDPESFIGKGWSLDV